MSGELVLQENSLLLRDLQDQLNCNQRSLANLRKDMRIIVREELQYFLREFFVKQYQVSKEEATKEVIN